MQIKTLLLALAIMGLSGAISGCMYCEEDYWRTSYSPVYMQRSDLENSIKPGDTRQIANPGNIYQKGSFVFIVEKHKGIHILDNQVPEQPMNVAFVEIPGCTEIQMRNNTLLVNNATDLVSIDVSEIQNPKVLGRIPDMFAYEPPRPDSDGDYYEPVDEDAGYVVDWTKETTKAQRRCN